MVRNARSGDLSAPWSNLDTPGVTQSIAVYRCYVCDAALTGGRSSVEHIVPSAVGGRLKSRRVWCSQCCESGLPRDLDAHLAEGLFPLATLLDLRRDRGRKLRTIRARLPNGDLINIRPDGRFERARPIIEDTEVDAARGARLLRVHAATPDEARRHVEAIKQKRYPDLDVDSFLATGMPTTELFDKLRWEFPTWDLCKIGRALTKVALHFHVHHWGPPAELPALMQLLHEDAPEDLFHATTRDPQVVPSTTVGPVLHRVDLVADASSRQVHARVEVLSVFHALVVLDRAYDGPSRQVSYGFDVVTGRQMLLPPPAPLALHAEQRDSRVVVWVSAPAANAVGQLGLRHAPHRKAIRAAIKTALAGLPPEAVLSLTDLDTAHRAVRSVL